MKLLRWTNDIKAPFGLFLALTDRRSSVRARLPVALVLVLMVAYVIIPIDIIPDAIPVVGWIDDLLLVSLTFMLLQKIVPAVVLDENRRWASRLVSRLKSYVILAASIAAAVFLALVGTGVFLLVKAFGG